MQPIQGLDYWVQKTLPQVYTDAMSYSELLHAVLAKLDEVIAKNNDYFGKDLKEYVGEILSEWFEDGTLVDIINGEVFTEITTRLSDTEKQLSHYDVVINMEDVFTDKVIGGTMIKCLDGVKVTALINLPENNFKTFYLGSGSYSLINTIYVLLDHEVSLTFSDGAIIKAVESMENMIEYHGAGNGKKKVITGGKFDGNGKANNCIKIGVSTNTTLKGIQISNPIRYGLWIDNGYELIANNLLFVNTITTNNNVDNTAIYLDTWDAVFNDITIVNYNTAMDIRMNGNYFTNVHIWSNQLARLNSFTYGIIDRGGNNFYDKVYMDTCTVGVAMYKNSYFKNCMWSYADTYKIAGVTPVYISNRITELTDNLFFDSCVFIYNVLNASGNSAQVVSGASGDQSNAHFNNCNFQTPVSLTNKPTNNTHKPRMFKFKISYSGLTAISTGNSVVIEKDFTALFSFMDLKADDTVIINGASFGWAFQASYFVVNNKIQVQINNCTTTSQTPVSNSAYVTVIKNFDNLVLPYKT